MSGNAKSKSSKNKPKNNNGQSVQNVNNGGPVVNSHANQSGCVDMNYMSSGQEPGQGMPQGPNMYPPPYMAQYQSQPQNQAFSGNLQNMQNAGCVNMQGQCQGQGGQQTQQTSVQYDPSGSYGGLQQNSPMNN